MKKTIPNISLPNTSTHAFGRCDAGHPPLFTVNPDIEAHDALVHVALYLRSAYEAGEKVLDQLGYNARGLCWANLLAVEAAEGIVEALLDGIESTPPKFSK